METMTEIQVAEMFKGVRDARQIAECPYCKTSEVKEYRQRDKHCSGQWNTSVRFACEAEFSYSPNLICVEQNGTCRDNPEWKARLKHVDEMREKLYKVAQEAGTHATDLKKLKERLDSWNPRWY